MKIEPSHTPKPTAHDPCRRRQERYLNMLVTMDPAEQKAFKTIYGLAQNRKGGGEHVIQAAIESVKHPGIFQVAKENIMIRSILAFARSQKQTAMIEKMETILEDLHIAMDAFMHGLSLEKAREYRLEHEDKSKTCARLASRDKRLKERFADEFDYIQVFAQSLRSHLEKLRRYTKAKAQEKQTNVNASA